MTLPARCATSEARSRRGRGHRTRASCSSCSSSSTPARSPRPTATSSAPPPRPPAPRHFASTPATPPTTPNRRRGQPRRRRRALPHHHHHRRHHRLRTRRHRHRHRPLRPRRWPTSPCSASPGPAPSPPRPPRSSTPTGADRDPRNDERGSITAFVAVVATALVLVAGMAYDGGQVIARPQRARNDAEQAARAGAQQIDLDHLRSDERTTPRPRRRRAAAVAYLARVGATGTATVDGRLDHRDRHTSPAHADPPRRRPDHHRHRDRLRRRGDPPMTSRRSTRSYEASPRSRSPPPAHRRARSCLATLVGWPLPTTLPIATPSLPPRTGISDTFIVNTLAVIAWIAWAQLALGVPHRGLRSSRASSSPPRDSSPVC
jgi:hypothetical protein